MDDLAHQLHPRTVLSEAYRKAHGSCKEESPLCLSLETFSIMLKFLALFGVVALCSGSVLMEVSFDLALQQVFQPFSFSCSQLCLSVTPHVCCLF